MPNRRKRELDFFEKPESIYRAAVMSGVFAKSDFLFDTKGFVDKIVGHWYMMHGNSCQPYAALEKNAHDLHSFYVMFRDFKDAHELYLDINGIRFSETLVALNNLDFHKACLSFGEKKREVMDDLMDIRRINISRETGVNIKL